MKKLIIVILFIIPIFLAGCSKVDDKISKSDSFSNDSNTPQNTGQITYENPLYTCDAIQNKDLCVYNVVKICDKDKKYCQEWLRENLNIGKYVESKASGASDCINIGTSDSPSWSCQGSTGLQKYCYGLYNQDGGKEINCQTDGGLYEWSEAMGLPKECNNSGFDKFGRSLARDCGVTLGSKTQGICPNGFHIPSKQEWLQLARNTINNQFCELRDYGDGIGGCIPSGHKLKKRLNIVDTGGIANGSGAGCDATIRNDETEKDDADCGSTNFDALLGGRRDGFDGRFYGRGSMAVFWSATPKLSGPTDLEAYTAAFVSSQGTTQDVELGKTNGLSVRCIKD
jgi:uncharacterized protein (TIGR02145 family)